MVMRKQTLEALLADLERWISSGKASVSGLSPSEFAASKTAFHAGSWCIVCAGEAAGQILKHYPDFPDKDLRIELTLANAARNRIAHGYYDLDEAQVWKTLTVSFSRLAEKLAAKGERQT
jgi:uncharacterized protein with HEPN domain